MMGSGIRRWVFLQGLCETFGLKRYCEVGCKEGRTVGHLLKTVPDLVAVAIDPWIPQPDNVSTPGRETYEEWDFSKIRRQFAENIGPNESRVALRNETSEAAAAVDPGGYDLVFIDALHDEEAVAQDIRLWLPKVRPGGFLTGHDYQHKHPGVMRAVASHFNLFDVGLGPDSVWFHRRPEQ